MYISDMIPHIVKTGIRPPLEEIREDVPNELKAVVVTCWNQDPEGRPTFPG